MNCHFMLNSVLCAGTPRFFSVDFENNCVKTNQRRPILSAAKMLSVDYLLYLSPYVLQSWLFVRNITNSCILWHRLFQIRWQGGGFFQAAVHGDSGSLYVYFVSRGFACYCTDSCYCTDFLLKLWTVRFCSVSETRNRIEFRFPHEPMHVPIQNVYWLESSCNGICINFRMSRNL